VMLSAMPGRCRFEEPRARPSGRRPVARFGVAFGAETTRDFFDVFLAMHPFVGAFVARRRRRRRHRNATRHARFPIAGRSGDVRTGESGGAGQRMSGRRLKNILGGSRLEIRSSMTKHSWLIVFFCIHSISTDVTVFVLTLFGPQAT